jgi:hypothetical protein
MFVLEHILFVKIYLVLVEITLVTTKLSGIRPSFVRFWYRPTYLVLRTKDGRSVPNDHQSQLRSTLRLTPPPSTTPKIVRHVDHADSFHQHPQQV